MRSEYLTACDQLVSALINGVWQGLLVVALAALSLKVFSRLNAATRHAAWLLTLMLVTLVIPAHWLRESYQAKTRVQFEAAAIPTVEKPAVTQGEQPDIDLAGDPAMVAAEPDEATTTDFDEESSSVHETAIPAISEAPAKPAWSAGRFLNPVSWNLAAGARIPRLAGVVLLGIWLTAAGVRLALLLWRLYQLRILKRNAFPPSAEFNAVFLNLCEKLVVGRRVALKLSATHRSPVLVGFVHPVILLPLQEAKRRNLDGTEEILRHELAHVRRRDDWVNLVQHAIQVALFFHPGVWWISRQLSLEREIACDDCVLQQGGQPRSYALLLANLAARMHGDPTVLAPGVSTNKSQLQQRINMILNTQRNTSPRLALTGLGFITSAAAVSAVIAVCWAPRLVLAQTPAKPAAASISSAEVEVSASLPQPPQVARLELRSAGATASLSPVEDVSGPKFKPEPPGADKPEPAAAPPEPPEPSADLVAPALPVPPMSPPGPMRIHPHIAVTPSVKALSVQYDPAARSSLERRLDRLEQLVESLAAQQNKKWEMSRDGWDRGEMNPPKPPKEIGPGKDALEHGRAAAEHARLASEDAKRATKQAEMEIKAKTELAMRDVFKGMPQELEALRRAREALGREIENLDRQIERLERNREKLDRDQKRQSEQQEQSEQHNKQSRNTNESR